MDILVHLQVPVLCELLGSIRSICMLALGSLDGHLAPVLQIASVVMCHHSNPSNLAVKLC